MKLEFDSLGELREFCMTVGLFEGAAPAKKAPAKKASAKKAPAKKKAPVAPAAPVAPVAPVATPVEAPVIDTQWTDDAMCAWAAENCKDNIEPLRHYLQDVIKVPGLKSIRMDARDAEMEKIKALYPAEAPF